MANNDREVWLSARVVIQLFEAYAYLGTGRDVQNIGLNAYESVASAWRLYAPRPAIGGWGATITPLGRVLAGTLGPDFSPAGLALKTIKILGDSPEFNGIYLGEVRTTSIQIERKIRGWEAEYLDQRIPQSERLTKWQIYVELIRRHTGMTLDNLPDLLSAIGPRIQEELREKGIDLQVVLRYDNGTFKIDVPALSRQPGMNGEPPKCFVAGTPILMADGTYKPIEKVQAGDWVMSFDANEEGGRGPLKPGRVTQTFRSRGMTFPFLGVRVTPGHHYLCGDGEGFLELARILEKDGTVVAADGRVVRARSGHAVDSEEDRAIEVAYVDEHGTERAVRLRAGTAFAAEPSSPHRCRTILDEAKRQGLRLLADGLLEGADGQTCRFRWEADVPSLPHLEVGRQMPFEELLRLHQTVWPLTGLRELDEPAASVSERPAPAVAAPQRAANRKAARSAGAVSNVTVVDATSEIGALLA